MAIPTGSPQQGDNSEAGKRSGIPTGRPPAQGSRPTGLPAARTGGGLPMDSGAPRQRPTSSANSQPRPASANPSPRPAQRPVRSQPSVANQRPSTRRPAPEPDFEEQLPDDGNFYELNDDGVDPFSDVPQIKDSYNDFDSFVDEDPFKPVDDDDLYDDDDYEDEQEVPVPVTPAPAPKAKDPAARVSRVSGNIRGPKRNPPSIGKEDSFVDEENLKLKVFGGKKKTVAKAGDFDARKNMEGQRKISRIVFFSAIVAIVGFGAFQTFVPQQSMSSAEVQNIVSLSLGDTGFPTQRGEGFAISFMDTLLNYSNSEGNRADRAAALSYFYGPTAGSDGNLSDESFSVSGGILQNVVYGPVVFGSEGLTNSAGSYKIGMLMRTSAAEKDSRSAEEKAATDLRWATFNVNVFYDELKDSFAIAPGSPTLLPPESVLSTTDVPAATSLGETYDDFPASVNATVRGFIEGYRISTKANWESIRQYIGSDADEELKTGLGGRYNFVDPKNTESSIKSMSVYKPDASGDTLKVDLTMDWVAINENDAKASFPSRYVVTLEKISGDDYKVARFSPYYWVEDTTGASD